MSGNNYYNLYLASVMELASSIVIKSEDTVDGLNQYVTDMGGTINEVDPTTWKYYLNVTGQYHPLDTMMTVVSMDNLETIDFTIANLQIHTATAAGYQYGTRGFLTLCSRYPNQILLIMGILYPALMSQATTAMDGTILAYPPGLIESNEYTFLDKLQQYIYGYKARWVNRQFNISDSLYPAVNHGIMYLTLPMAILNIRLEACGTNEVHSYHMRSYLASHQGLDQFFDLMTTDQAFWFYRNIAYIERNIGQQQTFDLLLEHIMTDRGIPLAEWLMEHDISQMPGIMDPNITFVRNALNMGGNDTSANVITLDEMLTNEQPAARDNALYQTDLEPAILTSFQNSPSSTLMTKVLESDMIDYTNSSPYILPDILLNHWLWLSSCGIYTAYITVTNPATNEQIPLSVSDAWTLMWYCWMGASGINLSAQVVPEMLATRVQRIPLPTVADLMSVVDPTLVSTSTAQIALSVQPAITSVLSTENFYDLCVEITAAANAQLNLIALQEHKDARGYVFGMVEQIYSDNIIVTSSTGQTYPEWLATLNLSLGNLTTENMQTMYTDILATATGVDNVATTSVASLQAAMVSMFSRLSSYNIQFLSTINETNIRKIDWPVIRVGDIDSSASSLLYLPAVESDVKTVSIMPQAMWQIDLNKPTPDEKYYAFWKIKKRVPLSAEVSTANHGMEYNYNVYVGVDTSITVPLAENTQGVIPVLGINYWLALTPDEQALFMDMYGDNTYLPEPAPEIPLPLVFGTANLDGLDWDTRLNPVIDPTPTPSPTPSPTVTPTPSGT
jgi:hypothetical protein